MYVFDDETPRQNYSPMSDRESNLTMAYASGRKDEREEWLPVLEALQSCLSLLECHEHELRRAPMSQEPECMRAARAAIAKVTGSEA